MRVLRRVLIKLFILLLVIVIFGGGAAAWRAYEQSTPEYAVQKYLTMLIEDNGDRAYTLLDQSEDDALTIEEYREALKARKYSLYSGFRTKAGETRHDENGNEYIDYHVEFLNAADEVEMEDAFTVKKQSQAVLGVFENWKVQSAHCMVRNYSITVPAGSMVYLNNVKADTSWIAETDSVSADTYVIPKLVPGKIGLTIRHGALESVNTTLDVTSEPVDYMTNVSLKQSAMDECKELGVKALKVLFTSAANGEFKDDDSLLENCKKAAKKFVKEQAAVFAEEGSTFKNVGISDFAAQFGEPVFTEGENGAMTAEMQFSFRYLVKTETVEDTGEVYEDGTAITETTAASKNGDATAVFGMAFYDGVWHIDSMELPVIPE